MVQFAFQCGDVLDAEVKDGSRQSRVGATIAKHLDEVARRSCSS
jgi:hypothetical protein